jgi:uncharacterized protein YbjT (DUF2867 family)
MRDRFDLLLDGTAGLRDDRYTPKFIAENQGHIVKRSIVVAGATGYLGRYLVAEFRRRGWHVRALVRDERRARASGLEADEFFEAEATKPAALAGLMIGMDMAVSALGITRQKDGMTYRDVDYQANVNLLEAAEAAGVKRFGYAHVLGAKLMPDVDLIAAKQAFVDRLEQSSVPGTVIAPTGYFSDMGEFLQMARKGTVYLAGDGEIRINPIDGEDLAVVFADAMEAGKPFVEAGGPEIFSYNQLADTAFAALGKQPRIIHIPFWVTEFVRKTLRLVTPQSVYGPVEFFLSAVRYDGVAPCYGKKTLRDHYARLAKEFANEAKS